MKKYKSFEPTAFLNLETNKWEPISGFVDFATHEDYKNSEVTHIVDDIYFIKQNKCIYNICQAEVIEQPPYRVIIHIATDNGHTEDEECILEKSLGGLTIDDIALIQANHVEGISKIWDERVRKNKEQK